MEEMKTWAKGLEAIKKLNFCGCGCRELGYKALLETLKAYQQGGDRRKWAEDRGGNWGGEGNGYDYLILYLLDAAGVMEHGGSVGGSWPNGEGEAIITFLEEWGCDPDNWPESDEF